MPTVRDIVCPYCKVINTVPAASLQPACESCETPLNATTGSTRQGEVSAMVRSAPAQTPRYPAVRALCAVHAIVGVIMGLGGLYLFVDGVWLACTPPEPGQLASLNNASTGVIRGAVGGGLLMAALIQFAAGQLLRIFMDQEEHQRAMRVLLEQVARKAG